MRTHLCTIQISFWVEYISTFICFLHFHVYVSRIPTHRLTSTISGRNMTRSTRPWKRSTRDCTIRSLQRCPMLVHVVLAGANMLSLLLCAWIWMGLSSYSPSKIYKRWTLKNQGYFCLLWPWRIRPSHQNPKPPERDVLAERARQKKNCCASSGISACLLMASLVPNCRAQSVTRFISLSF